MDHMTTMDSSSSEPDYTAMDSNHSVEPFNQSQNQSHYNNGNYTEDIIFNPIVQGIFCFVYATIFVLGIFGNVLVCYVVGRNKAMQTVTNFFITNLALADILLCALAVPFTPLYTFLGEWVFGRILCHLVPYAQGTSVYISTLTLTSIAIDRFFVIIYPFKPRMRLTTCLLIITGIWAFSLLATLPYGIFLEYKFEEATYTCSENWPPDTHTKQAFSGCTAVLQFILPFIIILFCYVKVSLKLSDRVKFKPGSKNSKKEALERERKQRTNRMLIAMVFIFGMSWLPLNVFNFLIDLTHKDFFWKYENLTFFFVHAMAMSSTCYNPFLYAWLNENFRKEFKQVLPCFEAHSRANSNRSKRFISQRTNCNGADTVQESLMPTTSQTIVVPAQGSALNTTAVISNKGLETIEEVNSSQAAPAVSVDLNKATASFTAETNEVIVHYPSPSFSSSSPPPATDNNNRNHTCPGNTDNKDKDDSSISNSPASTSAKNNNQKNKNCNVTENLEATSEKLKNATGNNKNNNNSGLSTDKNNVVTVEKESTSTTTTTTSNEVNTDTGDSESTTTAQPFEDETPPSCTTNSVCDITKQTITAVTVTSVLI